MHEYEYVCFYVWVRVVCIEADPEAQTQMKFNVTLSRALGASFWTAQTQDATSLGRFTGASGLNCAG